MQQDQEHMRDQLSAYLDGELDAERRAAVEAALAADPVLQAELEALRQVDGLYRALPVMTAPEVLEEKVFDALNAGKVVALRPARRPAWRIWLPVAAAAVVLLMVGVPWMLQEAPRDTAERITLSQSMNKRAVEEMPAVEPQPRALDAEDSLMTDEAAEADWLEMDLGSASGARGPSAPLAAAPMKMEAPAPALTEDGVEEAYDDKDIRGVVPEPQAGQAFRMRGGRGAPLPEELPDAPAAKALPEPEAPAVAFAPLPAEKPPEVPETAPAPAPAATAQESPALEMALPETITTGRRGSARAKAGGVVEGSSIPPRTLAERRFERIDDTWQQAGYAGETPTIIHLDSTAYKELLAEHPELTRLNELSPPIVFKAGESWYRLEAVPEAEE